MCLCFQHVSVSLLLVLSQSYQKYVEIKEYHKKHLFISIMQVYFSFNNVMNMLVVGMLSFCLIIIESNRLVFAFDIEKKQLKKSGSFKGNCSTSIRLIMTTNSNYFHQIKNILIFRIQTKIYTISPFYLSISFFFL